MKLGKLDLFAGVLVTVVWGCNFSVIELGLMYLDPFALTLLRFTFCAIPLVFFVRKPKGISYATLALHGTLFGAGLWWVVNLAIHEGLSAGLSSIFLQFSSFFTIILSAIFLRERINSAHIAGISASCSGLILALCSSSEQSTLTGILLILLAALSWSFCNLIVKINKPHDMLAFIIWSSLFSTLAIFLLTITWKGIDPIKSLASHMTWSAAFSILFQSFVTTILGYMIWNNLMKKYPTTVVAPLSFLVPVSGILTSVIFFEERLSSLQLIALTLVLVGISIFVNSHRLQLFLIARRSRKTEAI